MESAWKRKQTQSLYSQPFSNSILKSNNKRLQKLEDKQSAQKQKIEKDTFLGNLLHGVSNLQLDGRDNQ